MTRLFSFFRKESFSKRIEKIKNGDIREREKMIEEYIPFIIKTVSNKLNRYIESENSEEYSIGMEAFNEAIDKYEISKGNFISFAQLVIKSRITDYLRKISKHNKVIPISQFEKEEKENLKKDFRTEDFTEKYTLKNEIEVFEEQLKKFKINFFDLVNEAPKHIDTRTNGIRIAKYIVENKELKEGLIRKKTLPSKLLIEELGVSVKILKRSRKFIIATVLILDSDLEELKNYIQGIKGGAKDGL